MNLALSEALDLARRWETKTATINGSITTDGQELQIKFTGRVTVYNDGIVITTERGCEIAITATAGNGDHLWRRAGDPTLGAIGAYCTNRRINVERTHLAAH